MKNTRELWEKRAEKYKMKIEGVLPKSFPFYVNKYLNDWMWENIKSKVNHKEGYAPHRPKVILDVGCGYGRLAQQALKQIPNSQVYGVDISKTYVEIFNKSFAPRGYAQVADARTLPFKENFFDACYVVTTLMYLTNTKDQKMAIKEIFRVLKRNGSFIAIERNSIGQKIVTLNGLVTLIRGKKNKEIESVSFTKKYMTGLLKKNGFLVERRTGIAFFTLLLLFILVSAFFSKNLSLLFLKVAKVLDRKFYWVLTPSLYISYICVKK